MKQMTLKEIHSVNLDIMKDIHVFCEKTGIHYSLAYGSLIGAVRHKGFIPWDNDIDIMMPRPDFERFSREYKSGKYRLSSAYDEDSYVNMTRVYDNRTVVDSPGIAAKYKIGVWIDVFPIDAISDDDEISNNQFQRIRHYTKAVNIFRNGWVRMKNKDNLFIKTKSLIRQAQLVFYKGNIHSWHQKIGEICKENEFGSTKRCSSLLCVEANANNKQEIFATDDFQGFTLLPFEDTQFYVAKGYDNILRTIFGDYMQLPPVEKRSSHGAFGFYWK